MREMNAVAQRFWSKVNQYGPLWEGTHCWLWTGFCLPSGYGQITTGSKWRGTKKNHYAHRFFYEAIMGPIPSDLELDHLCRNHPCVNPLHLEAVTHSVNVARGQAGQYQSARTHCPRNHPYDLLNTRYDRHHKRYCRACEKLRLEPLEVA